MFPEFLKDTCGMVSKMNYCYFAVEILINLSLGPRHCGMRNLESGFKVSLESELRWYHQNKGGGVKHVR